MEKRCKIGGGEGREGGRGRTWSPGVGPRENKLSGWFWSKFSSAKCVYGGGLDDVNIMLFWALAHILH